MCLPFCPTKVIQLGVDRSQELPNGILRGMKGGFVLTDPPRLGFGGGSPGSFHIAMGLVKHFLTGVPQTSCQAGPE